MSGEASGADLRSLQVSQQGDRAALGGGDAAQAHDLGGVSGVIAVGEVEAGHVHALAQQLRQAFVAVGGRAEGADDLGLAKGDAGGCGVSGCDRHAGEILAVGPAKSAADVYWAVT